jgi:rubrerythrin
MYTKKELKNYWLDFTVKNRKHIPLIVPNYSRCVFRGEPNQRNERCIGFLRTRKSNQIKSYPYDIKNGWKALTTVEECDELITYYKKTEINIRKNIQNWIEHRRGLQKMLVEINSIPVEKGTQTWTTYKRLRSKQYKAESVFYGILARLDSGGRHYKNDGERMHKASADMKKYEKLADNILRIRKDEYFFEWGDTLYNSGTGVCHYIFTYLPKEKPYGNGKTIQIGTGNTITTVGGCSYTPNRFYQDEKNDKRTWCYIRTTADLAYVKKNLLAWINRDLKREKERLKRTRENLLQTKCALYEIELEREYLSCPELQEKERIAIETAIDTEKIESAREYAARPRYNVLNAVKLWNNRILWQCGKCSMDNTREENIENPEECIYCGAINKIKVNANFKWKTANVI